MSEEKKDISQEPGKNTEHFPEDSHAPKSVGIEEAGEGSNKQPETKNMDVHHHSHAHGKKNWKAYFWEFLMLFLAVFCGFLAEYKLEQIIERHRENEYITSMIEDLARDTTAINLQHQQRVNRKIKMDSLSFLLQQPDFLNYTAFIYYYARWVPRNAYFYSADRTIQQLKNAGGMRLITHKKAAEAIIDYDAQLKMVQTQNYSLEENSLVNFTQKMTALFDGNVLDEMYGDSLLSIPAGNPLLLTNDKKVISELASQLHFVKSLNNRNIYFENILKILAGHTIEVLKKEYRLE